MKKALLAVALLSVSSASLAAEPRYRSERCEYELMMLERTGILTLAAAACNFNENDFSPEARERWARDAERAEKERLANLGKWEKKPGSDPDHTRYIVEGDNGWAIMEEFDGTDPRTPKGSYLSFGGQISNSIVKNVYYKFEMRLNDVKQFTANAYLWQSSNGHWLMISKEPEATNGVRKILGKKGELSIDVYGQDGKLVQTFYIN